MKLHETANKKVAINTGGPAERRGGADPPAGSTLQKYGSLEASEVTQLMTRKFKIKKKKQGPSGAKKRFLKTNREPRPKRTIKKDHKPGIPKEENGNRIS